MHPTLVPITVSIAWTIAEGQTLIDIDYAVAQRTLSDVKFGLGMSNIFYVLHGFYHHAVAHAHAGVTCGAP